MYCDVWHAIVCRVRISCLWSSFWEQCYSHQRFLISHRVNLAQYAFKLFVRAIRTLYVDCGAIISLTTSSTGRFWADTAIIDQTLRSHSDLTNPKCWAFVQLLRERCDMLWQRSYLCSGARKTSDKGALLLHSRSTRVNLSHPYLRKTRKDGSGNCRFTTSELMKDGFATGKSKRRKGRKSLICINENSLLLVFFV